MVAHRIYPFVFSHHHLRPGDYLAHIIKPQHGIHKQGNEADKDEELYRTDKMERQRRADHHDIKCGKPQGGLRMANRKSTRLTPVTNAHLVCRLLLATKTTTTKKV